MSGQKSKLPDLHEISTMATKLFKDVKVSIDQIIHNYKQKRQTSAASTGPKPTAAKSTASKTKPASKSSSAKKH